LGIPFVRQPVQRPDHLLEPGVQRPELDQHVGFLLARVPEVVPGPRHGYRLLTGGKDPFGPVHACPEPAGDDLERLLEPRVNMLAGHRPVRLDDQMHQGGLVAAVLVAAQHHTPLAGDLVLVEIAVPCKPPVAGLDSGPMTGTAYMHDDAGPARPPALVGLNCVSPVGGAASRQTGMKPVVVAHHHVSATPAPRTVQGARALTNDLYADNPNDLISPRRQIIGSAKSGRGPSHTR
jgi:hypothetical protein